MGRLPHTSDDLGTKGLLTGKYGVIKLQLSAKSDLDFVKKSPLMRRFFNYSSHTERGDEGPGVFTCSFEREILVIITRETKVYSKPQLE